MVPYATHADVQVYFLDFPFAPTSKITDAQVDTICNTEQAEVDSILSAHGGYVVPVTGANSLMIMVKLVALRAAASCWRRLHVTTQSDQPTIADGWRKEADKLLSDILAGQVVLKDAQKESTASASTGPRITSQNEIFPRTSLDDFVSSYGPSS